MSNFKYTNKNREYAVNIVRKYNLPEAIIEAIDLLNGDMVSSANTLSEKAHKIKEVIEEGKIDVIKNTELAWQTLGVILYDKAKNLIENADIYFNKDEFDDFLQKAKKDNYLSLEFVPEDRRKSSFCREILNALENACRIGTFSDKAVAIRAFPHRYITGGTLLFFGRQKSTLKDIKSGKVLFQCKHIQWIPDTRLFEFSHDGRLWGVVDDLGRIVAEERFTRISFNNYY